MSAAATPHGDALARELRWVHDMLRADLAVVTEMAAQTLDGLPVEQVRTRIQALATTSPLWALRSNCLHYCRFVHLHHTLESSHLFPAVRATDRALGPVLDRLDAEHAAVSRLLDEVQAAAEGLPDDDQHDDRDDGDDLDAGRRARLAAALRALNEALLAHLDYEEEHILPVLRTWTGWPYAPGSAPGAG